MTKVLITGVAGFIGSHVAQTCLDEGWEVHGIDDLSNGHKEFIPEGVHFSQNDFAEQNNLDTVRAAGYDTVFHLAARARVSWSVERPFESNDNNVTKTLALLEACKGNIGRFVFSSSSSVYGNTAKLPALETEPVHPESPYALQKFVIEKYLELYASLYKLDSVSLRYFNVYGPHQVGGSPYATALGNWLAAIINDDYMRFDGDGSQSRDFTYVTDVARANVLAAKLERGYSRARLFNVGTGNHVSNNEILRMLGERFEKLKIRFAPARLGDVQTTQANITSAKKILEFEPTYDFIAGFEKTVEWALTSPHMKNLKSVSG